MMAQRIDAKGLLLADLLSGIVDAPLFFFAKKTLYDIQHFRFSLHGFIFCRFFLQPLC